MQQIFQNYKTGEVRLEEVPAPTCKPGGILVRTLFSAISPGTELMKISESKMSLIGKARARPDQVKKVLATLAQQGPLATYEKVMQRLDSLTPLGYSLCGEVEEVGAGVTEYKVGDRVACAGNAYALHADLNWVPVNLAVPVPASVPPPHAAFATIGSIALQGIRQASIQPGELVCVVGLGLIGQILVRMLKSIGARPVGVELTEQRCAMALTAGAELVHNPKQENTKDFIERIRALSDGQGCDHIIISAGGPSNAAIELAPMIGRDRARVTVIGKTGLSLSWNAFYEKEMEVVFSRSYGPGRYDTVYEEAGIDYPIGYIRWTERRNLQEVVRMMASGQLDMAPLISSTHDFKDAANVYERLNKGELSGIGFLFSYSAAPARTRVVLNPIAKPASVTRTAERVRVGAIGCGNYASSMLFPHLATRKDVDFVEIATTTAASSANAARRFGFNRMSTDVRHLLESSDIDLVMITTRHSSHADLVCAALESGKAVFVEKPLALTLEECDRIAQTITSTGNDRLMVGFNRRFAPLMQSFKSALSSTKQLDIIYRINAGNLDATSWYLDRSKEGSRFVGEGGHFIDTVSWLLNSDVQDISATRNNDDANSIVVTLRYPHALATILYLTGGDTRFPKERVETFGGGRAGLFDNFASWETWGNGKKQSKKSLLDRNKGQKEQLNALIAAVLKGSSMPIPVSSLINTTRATILADTAASLHRPVSVNSATC